MLTNQNLEARKPGPDAPQKEHYGYRTVLEFAYFMRENGINVTDLADLFEFNYQKIRSVLYGKPGTRTLVQTDLYRIAKIQGSIDFPYRRKINIYYLITGNKMTPEAEAYMQVAARREKMIDSLTNKLDKLRDFS